MSDSDIIEPGMDGDFDTQMPPAWPKVIGIIGICWAGLGILLLICGGIGIAMMGGSMISQAFPDGVPPQLTSPQPSQYIGMGIGAVLTVVLLTASILLLARNYAARMAFIVYSICSIGSAIYSTVTQMSMQADIAQWCRDHPGTKYAQSQNNGGGTIGLVIGIGIMVLMMSWPIFCLVWFGFVKTRREQYSQGKEQLM